MNKVWPKACYLLTITILLLSACEYKSEETLFGNGNTCDTLNVTYNNTIVSIINNNGCLSCHSGTTPLAGFTLTSYADVKTVAENGKLYGALFHLPGYVPMPQGGSSLSPCDLRKISAWINTGIPEN